jgi:hypothetical protein
MGSTLEQHGPTYKGEKMTAQPWTIPFDNTTYLCWKDKQNRPKYRQMTDQEDYEYFTAQDKQKYLNELLYK